MVESPLVWTIGAGGLLGQSVVKASTRRFDGSHVAWIDHGEAMRVLSADLERFAAACADGPWSIVWAAGAGTVGTTTSSLHAETKILEAFCTLLRSMLPSGSGCFVLASSAGGLYAGASNPPYDVDREPEPLSDYGHTKLVQERVVGEVLGDRVTVLLARFSNLYGPAQKLGKRQGLVSQLAYAAATRQAVSIFVPLETIRDYIHSDDAAAALHAHMSAYIGNGPGIKPVIIASGNGTSIAHLIRQATSVTHRRIPVALGTHHTAQVQARDSRFIPTPIGDGTVVTSRPLPVGIREVFNAMVFTLAQPHAVERV